MSLRFRLAAIDLDGTLLGPTHEISPRNHLAVTELVRRGVTCVIASGRMHEATTQFADALTLPGPIISYNGALVRVHVSGEVWTHSRVPAEIAAEIVRYCKERGHHLNYYLDDHLFVARRGEWAEFYLRQTGSPMEERGDLLQFAGKEPTKLILIDTPDVTAGLLDTFHDRFGASLYITRTNPEYLEFMNAKANKGEALKLVAGRLGVRREETIAFGDGTNDISMLQWAGFSVAMGSSVPEVLEAAGYIAPPCEEDGLASAIELLLNG